MRCDECVFWKMIEDTDGHKDDYIGQCKRYPPQIDTNFGLPNTEDAGSESLLGYWEQPLTDGAGWCGEFKGRAKS